MVLVTILIGYMLVYGNNCRIGGDCMNKIVKDFIIILNIFLAVLFMSCVGLVWLVGNTMSKGF